MRTSFVFTSQKTVTSINKTFQLLNMKTNICPIALLFVLSVAPRTMKAQQPPAYHVPDSFTFDYEVVQQMTGKKDKPSNITYEYNQAGSYMAIRPNDDKSKLIIFTKEGVQVIVDDEKKNILIMRIGGMIGDLAKAVNPAKGANGKTPDASTYKGSIVKTGNTKQISGYPAEEYKVTDDKGKVSTVWTAKVDFNASLFYLMNMGFGGATAGRPGAGAGRPGMTGMGQNFPSFSDPHLLFAEMHSTDKPDESLITQSITKKSMNFATKGYKVTDMSNMNLQDMINAQSKQN